MAGTGFPPNPQSLPDAWPLHQSVNCHSLTVQPQTRLVCEGISDKIARNYCPRPFKLIAKNVKKVSKKMTQIFKIFKKIIGKSHVSQAIMQAE